MCATARSGRSVTPTDKSHQQSVEEMIRENHLIKQKDTALKLGISKERVDHIINLLGFQNVYVRWVPQKLADEMKVERVTVSRELLGHFEKG